MKRCIGIVLVVLAAAMLLGCIRLPAKREAVTMQSSGRTAAVSAVPVRRGGVPVNTADQTTLIALPGIGEVIALEIIAEREANGTFFYPEDLMQVKGIGAVRLEAIYDMLDLSSGETGG